MPLHPLLSPVYSHLRSSNSPGPLPVQNMQHQSPMTQPPPKWNPVHPKYGYPYSISASATECADCNVECTEPMCSTSNGLTSQCTDQCVVITCSDPEHANLNCTDVHSHCDLGCDSATACADCDEVENLFQCCDGLHPCFADRTRSPHPSQQSQQQRSGSQYNWDASLVAALCDCGYMADPQKNYPSIDATPPSVFPSATDDSASQYPQPALSPYIPTSLTVPYPSISSSYSVSAHAHDPQAFQYGQTQGPPHPHTSPPSPSTPPFTCMWESCQAQFASLSELVGHVNLAHLRLPAGSELPNKQPNPSSFHALSRSGEEKRRMPCLWRDCTEYLQPQFLSGAAEDVMLSTLAHHLFQEHLGLHPPNGDIQSSNPEIDRILAEMATSQQQEQGQQTQGLQQAQYRHGQGVLDANVGVVSSNSVETQKSHENATNSLAGQPEANTFITPSPQMISSVISSPAMSVGEVPAGEGHLCLWEGCAMSFETCNDLMTHISTVHVGSGKPQYDCLWEGCSRNGEKGFSSKQKICRHLQSHTGYRPFQCPECLQNFSEAATLQQHRRRHTQEKPYKCDFPGCGKSFAITGALTIHKRVHNGQKPFKCSYCGRGFAESSNLSKHLRTHTGERPYICAEPGCGKAFARPDQLTRHMGVHRKKAQATATAEV